MELWLNPGERKKPLPNSNLPKYVYAQKIKKKTSGKTYTYYRFRRGKLTTKLPGEPGDPAFFRAYSNLLESERGNINRYASGSVAATMEAFITSPEFQQLADSTRKNYEMHLRRFDKSVGDWEMQEIQKSLILKMRDKMAGTPVSANHFIIAVSQLFNFAVERDICTNNPVKGISKLKSKGKGNPRWQDEQISLFRAKATPMMRLAVELGLYTGQRISDVLKLTWSDYDGKAFRVRQKKTGTYLIIPAHRELKAILADTPKVGITILTSKTGMPFHERVFSANFKVEREKVGVEGVTFHGLRHTAASKLAEAGCTAGEIQAITGHKNLQQVALYTKQAGQGTMAESAILKFERTD